MSKSLHHSRLPSCGFKQGMWINLCIDVKGFFEYCYPDLTFKQIDGITLQSFCLCRKIFALRSPVIDTSELDIHSIEIPAIDELVGEELPKHLQFKYGVNYENQLITPEKFLGIDSDIAIEFVDASDTEKAQIIGRGREPKTDHRQKGTIKESPAIEGSKSLKPKKPGYLKKGKRTVSESPYNRLKRHDFRPGDSSEDEEESKDGLSINGLGVSGKNTEASSVYTGTTKSKDDKKIAPFSAKRKKGGLKKTRVASLAQYKKSNPGYGSFHKSKERSTSRRRL